MKTLRAIEKDKRKHKNYEIQQNITDAWTINIRDKKKHAKNSNFVKGCRYMCTVRQDRKNKTCL